ncbi:MAG: hypothetical protein HYS17_05100 [Micavibrio aeruginosavorus]|uniref:Uncharacterized protein n=1 Tax=Micavibrio aeruginosavorus TaxID=349221 RepID=A0A7T5R453_9BACT|nr:MAG: hypothetical protein HYS17_05100 [Micavibrio aeruginosavorus]
MPKSTAIRPAAAPVFTRATLDRNMTVNTASFENALAHIDLCGIAVLDFGCGTGNLVRLLRETNADTIYAFEVMPEHLAPDIRAWAADPSARPRLILNPWQFKMNPDAPDGDLTAYDYARLLGKHEKFAIVSNPPYFLYNRILSLTLTDKFAGALMITSRGRLHNHPGWHVLGVMDGHDFNPPAYGLQYLVQTGFEGQTHIDRTEQPCINGQPQIYPPINNREPQADRTDHYPEMWEQLGRLPRRNRTPGIAP